MHAFKVLLPAADVILFIQLHWQTFVLGYFSCRILYNVFFHPLARYPGPWLAKVSDLWKANATFRGRYQSYLLALHNKHGDVVRIGPNEISVVAPDQVRDIYGSKEYLKGPFYAAFTPSLFSNRDATSHALHRRAVAHAYSSNYIKGLEPFCDACAEKLLAHLDDAAVNGEVIDVGEVLEWFAYDTITSMGFGEPFGLFENKLGARGIPVTIDDATKFAVIFAVLHSIGWIIPTKPVIWLAGRFSKGQAAIIGPAHRLVTERKDTREREGSSYESKGDMLDYFLDTSDPSMGEPLQRDIVAQGLMVVAAGADTTRTTMAAFMRYVYDSPSALARLRAELEEATARGELGDPPTCAETNRLEYFQAALKETMRLHPVFGLPLQRVVPKGARMIVGHHLPAGTLVGMLPRSIHRDERAFGKDASEFRPERWLEDKSHELEKYNLAFGQGSRICIGKNIAMLQMKVLATIVQRYDLEFACPTSPYVTSEHVITPQHGFNCVLKRRSI